MRSVTVEMVQGRADGNGIAFEGPCTIQKVSSGKYNVFAPPGRKILSIVAVPFTPAQWLIVKADAVSGRMAQVTFANTAPTESDSGFVYTMMLAA